MVVEVALMIVGIGLSIAAGYMLQKKIPAGQDDKPVSLATRGSFAPWVRGVRRVGPIFCWVADNKYTTEVSIEGTGKGLGLFADKKQTIWHQSGTHVLCAGTAYALHEITVNGKRVVEFDKVTRDSHPSGTLISLGLDWAFRIYWGGPDQDGADPDPYMTDAIGVESVFPFFCYVVWQPMQLGPQVMWPSVEYLLEVRSEESTLVDSDPEILPSYELVTATVGTDSPGYHEIFRVDAGPQGSTGARILGTPDGSVGYFLIGGWDTDFFFAGSRFRRTDLSGADEEYTVHAVERLSLQFQIPADLYGKGYSSFLAIYPVGGVEPAAEAELGTAWAYNQSVNYGVNLAHAIEEMLFLPFPKGAGMSKDRWDIDSLEALGVLMADEDYAGSIIAQNGASVRDVLGPAMQDMTCGLTQDPSTGLQKFAALRTPVASAMEIPNDLLIAPLPERDIRLSDDPVSKLIFNWPDRSINYRDMTVIIDDDGRADMGDAPRARKVPITTCIDYATGVSIAERRAAEELGDKNVYTIYATRAARTLVPGDTITCEEFGDEVLRVVGVGLDPATDKVVVKVISDFFGVDPATFDPPEPPGARRRFEAEPDAGFMVVELPAIATGDDSRVQIAVPRIRSKSTVAYGRIHISVDGSTYTDVGSHSGVSGGGVLTEALSATGEMLDTAVTYLAVGVDDTSMPDYTSDAVSWRTGRLLVVAGGEIMFAQSLTALGSGVFRLNNVLRARFDTAREDHAIGDGITVTPLDRVTRFANALIVPGLEPLYVKAQPVDGYPVALSLIEAVELDLYGKGPRPMPCANLRCFEPTPCVPIYGAGDDITLRWSYRSFQYRSASPALLPAGEARGEIAFEGSFVLEMLNASDTLIATHNSTSPEFEYTNAQLVADFGSEPSSFKVRLSATANGRTSSSITLTITKV